MTELSSLEKAFSIAVFKLYDDFDIKTKWLEYRSNIKKNEYIECATDFIAEFDPQGFGLAFSKLIKYFFPDCSGLYYYNPSYFSNGWFSYSLLQRIDKNYFGSTYWI